MYQTVSTRREGRVPRRGDMLSRPSFFPVVHWGVFLGPYGPYAHAVLDIQKSSTNLTAAHVRLCSFEEFADEKQVTLHSVPGANVAAIIARAQRLADGNPLQFTTAPAYASESAFAGQLLANILFDVTQVIEEALREKQGAGLFKNQVEMFFPAIGSTLATGRQSSFGTINGDFNTDFDATLGTLLDRTYQVGGTQALTEPERQLAIAYGIRNKGAHHLASSRTIRGRFPEVERALLHALFLVVEKLYPARPAPA